MQELLKGFAVQGHLVVKCSPGLAQSLCGRDVPKPFYVSARLGAIYCKACERIINRYQRRTGRAA